MVEVDEVHPGVARCAESQELVAQAEATVQSQGLATHREADVLVVEQRTRDTHWGDCYVVPAVEVFAGIEDTQDVSRRLRRLHSALEEEKSRNRTAQVFILGTSAMLAAQPVAGFAELVCTNEMFGVKLVGTLEVLQKALSPAFPPTSQHRLPRLYTGPATRLEFHRAEPQIDARLSPADFQALMHSEEPSSASSLSLLTSLYARVLGPRRSLMFVEGYPELCLSGDSQKRLPLEYCGRSEQVLFCLLKFLVLQYESAEAGKVVCIEDVVSSFDTVSKAKLLSIFTDFCDSTGMDLYLKTAQGGFSDWAGRRFCQVFGVGVHTNLAP